MNAIDMGKIINLFIEVQSEDATLYIPDEETLRRWISVVLCSQKLQQPYPEIALRIVDECESAKINKQYRGADSATNVLSFPCFAVAPEPIPILGDIIMCAPVITREASEQGKYLEAHWAHILVHGILHLLGYDHESPEQACRMESLETQILKKLNYPHP